MRNLIGGICRLFTCRPATPALPVHYEPSRAELDTLDLSGQDRFDIVDASGHVEGVCQRSRLHAGQWTAKSWDSGLRVYFGVDNAKLLYLRVLDSIRNLGLDPADHGLVAA